MSVNKFRIFIFSLIVFTSACREKAVEPSAPCNTNIANLNYGHPKAGSLQALLTNYVKKGLPGAVVLIEDQNGLWAGSAGKADLEQGIPMQICHINKTASLTKPFMGALTMKLVEEGVFNLDDPITKFIPSEKLIGIKNAEASTIRMLMAHQTGIYDVITDSDFYLSVLNNPNKSWSQEELLKFVKAEEPYFPTGTSAGYSNTNTLLLSMAIEGATGRMHAELLRKKILNPLNLTNTYYHWHEKLPEGKVAQGYFDLYNNQSIINVSNLNTGNGNGYNGIYSNVGDLYSFTKALLIDKTLISETSLQSMLTFHPLEETGKLLGAGLIKDFIHRAPDEYAFGHRGRDLSCSAEMFYFPEKNKTFIFLVNYGNDAESSLRPLYFELKDKLVDELLR